MKAPTNAGLSVKTCIVKSQRLGQESAILVQQSSVVKTESHRLLERTKEILARTAIPKISN